MRNKLPGAIIALLAAAAVLPRVYAGTLLVRYDILFWESHGNGYAPTTVALSAKLLSLVVAVVALASAAGKGSRRLIWALVSLAAVASFFSITRPPESDFDRVIPNGQMLVSQVEAYHKAHGRYPDRLSDIPDAAKSGLAEGRRFYYVCADSRRDDKGPWFPSTRAYLGDALYVVCVPMVPGGTLVYRPVVGYSDLPGYPESNGWYHTTRD